MKAGKTPKTKSSREENRVMPTEPIEIALTEPINATLMHDFDRFDNGNMMLAITSATVTQDGKEIGDIRGSAHAPVLSVSFGRRSWQISSEQLFAAVLAADREYQKKLREAA